MKNYLFTTITDSYETKRGSYIYVTNRGSSHGPTVRATIIIGRYQAIELTCDLDVGIWNATYFRSDGKGYKLDSGEAFTYVKKVDAKIVPLLNKIAKHNDVKLALPKSGNANVVEKIMREIMTISNMEIKITAKRSENKIGAKKHHVQISFEMKNNTKNPIKIKDLSFALGYEGDYPNNYQALRFPKQGNNNSWNKTLNPNDTISLQFSTNILIDAYDYYIELSSTEIPIYYLSDVFNA